jgi:hypothetical protein
MSDQAKSETGPSERGQRAREWIRTLSEIPERFAGTAAERSAAERTAEWMRELGARDVSIVPTPGAPKPGYVLALHSGLAVLGCLWSGFLGVALTILAAWSFRREYRRHQPFLAKLLPAPNSVNVIGRIGAEAPARRVVLTGHIDAAQAGWLFSRQMAERFAGVARSMRRAEGSPPGPLALPEALLIGAALVTLAAWLGAQGFLLDLLKVALLIPLLGTMGLSLQWAMARATPGANDNASAVAAMLTCAERLLRQLPGDVELQLVGTGAEEVGCCGMRGFVARHSGWSPESTYFVNFECVGGGLLHFIRSEGVLEKVHFPPMLLELARRVAASGAFGEVTPTDLLASTDGHVPAERGYPTLSLISLDPNGVPINYHRIEDTVDGIDTAMVVRAADFAAAVSMAALRAEAGPIADVIR